MINAKNSARRLKQRTNFGLLGNSSPAPSLLGPTTKLPRLYHCHLENPALGQSAQVPTSILLLCSPQRRGRVASRNSSVINTKNSAVNKKRSKQRTNFGLLGNPSPTPSPPRPTPGLPHLCPCHLANPTMGRSVQVPTLRSARRSRHVASRNSIPITLPALLQVPQMNRVLTDPHPHHLLLLSMGLNRSRSQSRRNASERRRKHTRRPNGKKRKRDREKRRQDREKRKRPNGERTKLAWRPYGERKKDAREAAKRKEEDAREAKRREEELAKRPNGKRTRLAPLREEPPRTAAPATGKRAEAPRLGRRVSSPPLIPRWSKSRRDPFNKPSSESERKKSSALVLKNANATIVSVPKALGHHLSSPLLQLQPRIPTLPPPLRLMPTPLELLEPLQVCQGRRHNTLGLSTLTEMALRLGAP
jgi:hypothetical protein